MTTEAIDRPVELCNVAPRDLRITRRIIDEWDSGRGREHSSEDFNWLGTLMGRLIARREQILLIIEKDSQAARLLGLAAANQQPATSNQQP
jgi:hypothetical protein